MIFFHAGKETRLEEKAPLSLSSLSRSIDLQNHCPKCEEATKENAAPKVGNQKGTSDGQFKKSAIYFCGFCDG